jgi:hypothetical protein
MPTTFRPEVRPAQVAFVACWSFPALLVGSLYATWLLAGSVLGHRPRANLDDPTSISALVNLLYCQTCILVVLLPGAVLGGVAALFWEWLDRRVRPAGVAVRGVLLAATYAGAIALLRWDPLSVSKWFID